MISHKLLARASCDIYEGTGDWMHAGSVAGVVFGIRVINGVYVVVFRGSISPDDFVRDAEAMPMWTRLGFVHSGMYMGMPEVLAAILALLPAGAIVVFTGHSLGGARARYATAEFLLDGRKVLQLVTFGSPKPGFANLARIIQKAAIRPVRLEGIHEPPPQLEEHVSYRNRNDIVPMLPGLVPPLSLLWAHPEPWTAVDSSPDHRDLDALRDHSSSLYWAAMPDVQALAA